MNEWLLKQESDCFPVNIFTLHSPAFGPFVFFKAGGVRQVQTARGKTIAFSSDSKSFITSGDLAGAFIYTIDDVSEAQNYSPSCVLSLQF